MKDVANNRLLNRNGTWYYRRAVPKHLVDKVGRPVIQHSLKTKDIKQAKKLREVEDVKWSAYFAAMETDDAAHAQPPTLTDLDEGKIIELVRNYVDSAQCRFEESERTDPATRAQREEVVAEIEMELAMLRDPDDPRPDEWISSVSRELLGQAAHEALAAKGQEYARYAEIVRRGLVELERRMLARYRDEFGNRHFDTLFDSSRPVPAKFKALADQYLAMKIEEAEANGMSAKWSDKLRAQVSLVRELVGDDKPVATIDYDWCLRARSLLAQVPANRTKHYPHLKLEAAIEQGAKDGKPAMSPTTQGRYLDTLRDILELAVLKRLQPNNPASTLRPLRRDTTNAADKRLPFTPEQIAGFFASPFYKSCSPDAPKPYSKSDREWRFWLPLLAVFMGMRPVEICQMVPADVKRTAKGTWFVDVVASADNDDNGTATKTLKTATSRRKIPVHPELIALGFVTFAGKKQKADANRLFNGLTPDKYGNLATYPLKRFRDTFLKEAITLQPKQTFYSFRHSFRDALRRSHAGPDVLKALGGWSQGHLTSDCYGDTSDPDLYVKAMAKVSYPGVDLAEIECHGPHCPHASAIMAMLRADIGILNEVRGHVL